MNLPNKLTIVRIIATPLFMAAMLVNFPYHYAVSLVLFILAALTDAIDGHLARKNNIVTSFGKFLDPLADKMLTTAAFLGFICMFAGTNYCWQITAITFIILFREFMISSIRLVVVSSGGKVIAANIWGKLKTVVQMVGIGLALFAYVLIGDFGLVDIKEICDMVIVAIFWLSALFCVISGTIYLIGSKDYIDPSK